jgi:RsiW-degrading membrane proteinase PrsW (M82 family)
VSRRRRPWLSIFGTGLLLWILAVVVTYATQNANLIPTIILLGSFLVPATFVAWAFERRDTGELTAELVFKTFLVGGVLGVLGASVLETYLLRPSPWLFLGVGLIEEAVKLLALALLTHRLEQKTVRDGAILGAAVGFGFAAFESAGYAMIAMFSEQGLSLSELVSTELLRGLLAPAGHGLWTAILGAVLFSRSTRTHFHLTFRLLLAYLGVSVLHGLWDSMRAIAVIVTLLLTGQPWQIAMLGRGWIPRPTAVQVQLITVTSWVGLAVIAAIGALWLFLLVRRRQPARAAVPAYRVATHAP